MFEKEIAKTLEYEGGFVNDAADSGGATMGGLSLPYLIGIGDADHNGTLDFDLDKDGDVDPEDVKLVTREMVVEHFRKSFCEALSLDKLASLRVRWKILDLAVNCGRGSAVQFAQRIVGVKVDGVMGPGTVAAINAWTNGGAKEFALLVGLSDQQMKRYIDAVWSRPEKLKFLHGGWYRRCVDRGEGLA